jgi:NDP-sugar pyrophosphorylase family protein
MRAGIIAAGFGERLQAAGIATPKPLLEIGGRPLIARTIETACHAGATSIACIVNAESDQVRHYLEATQWPVPVIVLQRTTQSSAESFLALRSWLENAPFLLTTVDTICAPSAVTAMVAYARTRHPLGSVLGITRTIEDEKPLWVELDTDDRIRSLDDATHAHHVTAGVYFLQPLVYSLADVGGPRGFSAFRHVLGSLLAHGHDLWGFDVGTSIDVDRPQDIAAAERLLGVNRPI